MKLTNYRYIKSIILPTDWKEASLAENAINVQSIRSFAPESNKEVRMELFYRGLPLAEAAKNTFRKVLSNVPLVIFDANSTSAIDTKLLHDLEFVLGNIGNNQIVNKQTGKTGAPFMLLRLEALLWNNKAVLAARGHFKNPQSNKRGNEFCGFFIDSDPSGDLCKVEEIYLQAPSEAIQLQYLPAFQECLRSLDWL